MRIALVHDYLNQYGGAEKVLQSFMEIYPDAPIYTLIYDYKVFQKYGTNPFLNKKIYTSFLQKVPFAKSYHRIFPPLMPLAVENLDLSDYDIVLSDSASFAKGIITKPKTLHISYCLTPPRYAWDDSHKYIKEFGFSSIIKKFIPFFMNYIRLWDKEAALRVDKFICDSHFVAQRIKKYYKRKAKVIYPPVETEIFKMMKPNNKNKKEKPYFLMVGRLLTYKRFDVAIEAFNKLGLTLKIVGNGPERKRLKKVAKNNIQFLGELQNDKLNYYYQNCRALIFPQEEDFGIVALEAMACGKPVIAYQGGGALESVEEGETGVFFDEQTSNSLIKAVKNFELEKFNSKKIRKHALKFSEKRFKKKIKDFVEKTWQEWNANQEIDL